jgi:hypothetical protein
MADSRNDRGCLIAAVIALAVFVLFFGLCVSSLLPTAH